MILVFGLLIILIMVRTDYLQSYSPFVDTRYSLKGKNETPEQYIRRLTFHKCIVNFSAVSYKKSFFTRFIWAILMSIHSIPFSILTLKSP